jgi:soluble lytic murein transglycosylase-like protein
MAESEIYYYIDENGCYHYSNVPTSDKYIPLKMDFGNSSRSMQGRTSTNTYDAFIREAANANQVDFALVKAVIKAESGFDPYAVSRKGAQGLMQIMPANFESFSLLNPFDPKENIKAGTRYLKYLIDRYDHDLHLALAAYNAGPGVVDRYGDIPPFQETRGYVSRVLSYYDHITHGR